MSSDLEEILRAWWLNKYRLPSECEELKLLTPLDLWCDFLESVLAD